MKCLTPPQLAKRMRGSFKKIIFIFRKQLHWNKCNILNKLICTQDSKTHKNLQSKNEWIANHIIMNLETKKSLNEHKNSHDLFNARGIQFWYDYEMWLQRVRMFRTKGRGLCVREFQIWFNVGRFLISYFFILFVFSF